MKMNENVKNTAGKKEKSGFSEFITVLICCLLFGMICGYFCADSSFQFSLDLDTVYFLGNLSVWIMGTVNLICAALCFGKINKAGSLIRSWDGEDDELPAKAESLLAVPMTVSSVVFIFNMMMSGICGWLLLSGPVSGSPKNLIKSCALLFLISAAIFLAALGWILFVQNKAVNMIKELNPEKQGNIFQLNFKRTWMNSMDELEQQNAFKAGFAAYKTMNGFCLGFWAFAFIGLFACHSGVLPVMIPCIIMLAGNISYLHAARKPDRPRH